MGMLQDERILITGADGFIGSHLTEMLVQSGCNVRAFVLYNSFGSRGWLDTLPRQILKEVEIYAGDIRDSYRIRDAMKGCGIAMHLAALIAIPYSYASPESYVETNVKGTLNVLQAARELNVRKVVHTSTSEVYGTAQFVPISEDHPLQAQSPYSASKIGADQVALSFYRSFDTPVSIVRPFNTYGPRQSARAVIPAIITQLASGQRRIRLGLLHPTRDFSYVEDTVRGFCAVAESADSVGEVINLGSGCEISIGDVATLIADLMGVELEIESEEVRLRPQKSEVFRLWSDNTKARKLLGWSPKFSGREGLRAGLKETIDWFIRSENSRLYKSEIYNI
jgi:NAD dependent epimerase/dehydratase